jgi:uncharacterized protein HemY
MDRSVGLVVIALGIAAVIVGLAISTGALGWFGRLPGDIRIRTDSTRVYVPITSMLLVSIAVTVVAAVLRRFL